MEGGGCREVEVVGVGGVVRGFFEWAFVWGDVDPHGGTSFGTITEFINATNTVRNDTFQLSFRPMFVAFISRWLSTALS